MKKVLLGTLAVLTLAACSKDEVIQQNPNDAISFSVTTNKAVSRAADGYCNLSLPGDFQVWAEVGNKTYFAKERYVQNGGTASKTFVIDGAVRYWPETDATVINFYAACNKGTKGDGSAADSEIDIQNWGKTDAASPTNKIIKGYTIETTVAKQKDLLYAVVKDATRPSGTEGKIDINFRHALSQIEFAAQNKNKNIYVEISKVQVVKVNNKGDFKFPTSATTNNVEEHTFAGAYPTTVGTWENQTGSETYTTKEFSPVVKLSQKQYDEDTHSYSDAQAKVSSLTVDDPTSPKKLEYNENTMYLLPQTITPWDPSAAGKPADGTGAYFLVKAKIWNVPAGDGKSADTSASGDVVLWDNTKGGNEQFIAIPIPTITWAPGKRYVYTFIFTPDGNGGYNPEPSNPSTPEPVLVPIKLSITVDDFVDGGNTGVNMVKP